MNVACVLALLSIVVGCQGTLHLLTSQDPRGAALGWREPGGEWPAGRELWG